MIVEFQASVDEDSPDLMMPPFIKILMNDFLIPAPYKEEIACAVGLMGRQLWDMFWPPWPKGFRPFMRQEGVSNDVRSLIECVSWTGLGTLDWAATTRSLYFAGKFKEDDDTFMLICRYCLEDCIKDLYSKLSYESKHYLTYYDGLLPANFYTATAAYWMHRITGSMQHSGTTWFGRPESKNLMNVFRIIPDTNYDETYSIEESMFMLSFIDDQYYSVKYFWELLDDDQRSRIFAKLCDNIASDESDMKEYKDIFFSDKKKVSADLLIFFLQQLSFYGRDDIRIQVLGSSTALAGLFEWPYDNFIIKILRESLNYHDSIIHASIIFPILKRIGRCCELQFIDEDVIYSKMLYRIWKMNPENVMRVIENEKVMWNSGDVEDVHRILEEQEVKDKRKIIWLPGQCHVSYPLYFIPNDKDNCIIS